ncbi:hemolysin family protein [Tistrella mobilis]|uniref:Magnesium/cobalt efflux protein n=2 Tax=Tistrella mobilis TaxID=171437 RepID=A0A162KZD3_9PROT|nr:magnesium/cobalt efflux protein [Tistrella mobilis]
MSWLGGGRSRDRDELRESLVELAERIEGEEEEREALDPAERQLVTNVLKLGDLTVEDVMVPRADIIAIEISTPIDAALRAMAEAGHSRLPVYRGTLDELVGMVHIKDVVGRLGETGTLESPGLVREVLFEAPSRRVLDLLNRMRTTRIHLAIVVDEYGGTDGLVTIEDLVEQIVGEIEDEHDDQQQPRLEEVEDGVFEADARLDVEELEARLDRVLVDDDEDVDTLGGLVFALTGRVPAAGETVEHPAGLVFEVLDADPRRIKRLRIRVTAPEATTAA